MHDNYPHHLLSQVPLLVSPSANLPAATTLPYTYQQMPQSLPPSQTGITASTTPHEATPTPGTNTPSSAASVPAADPSAQPPADLPRYIISPSGTSAAHPSEIAAQCTALLSHITRLSTDGEAALQAWEDKRKEKDLMERRKKAPGWLDSGERMLVAAKTEEAPTGDMIGMGGAEGGSIMGHGDTTSVGIASLMTQQQHIQEQQHKSASELREDEEEREIADAVKRMGMGGQGPGEVGGEEQGVVMGRLKTGRDLGLEMDLAFGGK